MLLDFLTESRGRTSTGNPEEILVKTVDVNTGGSPEENPMPCVNQSQTLHFSVYKIASSPSISFALNYGIEIDYVQTLSTDF